MDNNKTNIIFLINGWNNWKEGTYLEPDDKFGFASINAFSKALFNISYINENYNLEKLKIRCNIAIQSHIYYEDLIEDIINKINNIPIKYDLFISTTSILISNSIKDYISKYSNANHYEIIILDNKGRDVLPFLIQLKNKFKNYKYICHIHSKKSKTSPEIGISWRNYLYNNLLGNERIISEILSDFETNEKLGFIFPETFYEIIPFKAILTKNTFKYMKYLLNKFFPNYKIGPQIDFPAGNMFWAKTKAIYQIFEVNLNTKFANEKDQTNDTIMHGIERIWLYLVKLNGYYYKTILKCL
jgi:lipopolysaccharide biosynthesis protein